VYYVFFIRFWTISYFFLFWSFQHVIMPYYISNNVYKLIKEWIKANIFSEPKNKEILNKCNFIPEHKSLHGKIVKVRWIQTLKIMSCKRVNTLLHEPSIHCPYIPMFSKSVHIHMRIIIPDSECQVSSIHH
jgi:hypothetical protein